MNGPFFHFSGTFHSPFQPGGNRGRRTSSRLLPPRCRAQRRHAAQRRPAAIAGGITGEVGRWRFFGVQTEPNGFFMVGYGYGSIPINTIFRGMNIHLPAILVWTTGVQGFDTLPYHTQFFRIWLFIIMVCLKMEYNYPQIDSRAMKKIGPHLKWSLNEISWKSAEGENMEDDTNEIGKYGQLWRTIENQHNICDIFVYSHVVTIIFRTVWLCSSVANIPLTSPQWFHMV